MLCDLQRVVRDLCPTLYFTYPSHAHYMTHLFHLHWSNYSNIMNNSNNKPHYIFFWVLLLLTSSVSQKFSWITFFSVPQNTLFLQCERSHFTPIKMKGMFDFWWMKKHSTASSTSHALSHKIKASFLKNCSKSIPQSNFCFTRTLWYRSKQSCI